MDRGGDSGPHTNALIEKPWSPAATSKMADAMCARDRDTTLPIPAVDTTSSASRHCHAGKRATYYPPQQPSKPATIAAAQVGRKYPVNRPLPRAETELITKCSSPARGRTSYSPPVQPATKWAMKTDDQTQATPSLPPQRSTALRGPRGMDTPERSCSPIETNKKPTRQHGWTVF
ncbi:Hypothetical predicted protein [Pelobates cultripes]|uniref:Uncharacterized protein n=1 Tax=Pelobates cultripes TaxID=61616 RepID=A0AAD1WYH6_PELCU|nr:Hypothetical predicted protein [Pelobates cultripes]